MALDLLQDLGFRDRMWLRVDSNKIPRYPIFYLLTGDDRGLELLRPCLSFGPLNPKQDCLLHYLRLK